MSLHRFSTIYGWPRAVDRLCRSKSSEERRTAATNSLQSRVVSQREAVTPHLCLCCRCSFYLCTATHTIIFLLLVCTGPSLFVNARLSADETRFFYLRAHTVKVVVEMLLTTVYTAIFRSSCHTHTYKFFH